MRLSCFAPNTWAARSPIAELRHRLRARAEDRIRATRATGLRKLPLHHTARNRISNASHSCRTPADQRIPDYVGGPSRGFEAGQWTIHRDSSSPSILSATAVTAPSGSNGSPLAASSSSRVLDVHVPP